MVGWLFDEEGRRRGLGGLEVVAADEGEFGEECAGKERRSFPASGMLAPVYNVGKGGKFYPGFGACEGEDGDEHEHGTHPLDRYRPKDVDIVSGGVDGSVSEWITQCLCVSVPICKSQSVFLCSFQVMWDVSPQNCAVKVPCRAGRGCPPVLYGTAGYHPSGRFVKSDHRVIRKAMKHDAIAGRFKRNHLLNTELAKESRSCIGFPSRANLRPRYDRT